MDTIDLARTTPELAPPAKASLAEPSTARALWPTFMRRTLSEEDLRSLAPRPPREKTQAS